MLWISLHLLKSSYTLSLVKGSWQRWPELMVVIYLFLPIFFPFLKLFFFFFFLVTLFSFFSSLPLAIPTPQVSQEHHRYSTGSESSHYEKPLPFAQFNGHTNVASADALSNLSHNSSLKKPLSSFVSTSEFANGSHLDLSENELVGEAEEQNAGENERNLDFHLERYIIPSRQRNEEAIPLEQRSSSMNKLNRPSAIDSMVPVPPLSCDIPSDKMAECTTCSHHSSSPEIQFRPGFSGPMALPDPIPRPMNGRYCPEDSNSDNCASPSSVSVSGFSSPSSMKSSLPNININQSADSSNNTENEYEEYTKQETLPKRRGQSTEDDTNRDYHSLEMTSSDCWKEGVRKEIRKTEQKN